MFETTSYNNLGDAEYAAGSEPLWFQQGYASKAAWKAANPSTPDVIGGAPGATTPGGAAPGAAAAPGASAGGFLSGIPTTYLLIGAAIIAVMVLKK